MNKELVSIIIPSYNEEKKLPLLINNVRIIFSELVINYEIIISNNDSTDKTSEVGKLLGCKVVEEPERNIGKARNKGAKSAKGEILIFIDADSIPSKNLIIDALNKIRKPEIEAVSTVSSFKRYPTLTSYGVWLYNLFSKILRLGVGQFIVIKNSTFKSLKGFDESYYAFEEIDLFRRLKLKYGKKSFFISLIPIETDARKFEKGKADIGKFLILLLASILGSEVGKNKSKLDYWYKEGYEEKYAYKKIVLVLLSLFLAFDSLFLLTGNIIREFSHFVTPLVFILYLILLIDNIRTFKAFLLIFCLTMFIEIVGSKTGFPFGEYIYNEDFSFVGILGVPIYIGFSWFIITASVYRITKNIVPMVLLVVLVDIVLEVFAKYDGLWKWMDHDFILTAPIQNYLSWGILAAIIYFIIRGKEISLYYSTFSMVLLMGYLGGIILIHGNSFGYISLFLAIIFGILGLKTGIKEIEE